MRPVFEWNTGSRTLQLGKRTYVMGVLNVTPDSFSDGGQHLDPEAALQHALKMLEDGADIIDIGGESTRPGAKTGESAAAKPAVSEKEELERVVPVIKALKKKKPECMISVDTYKAVVARAAFDAGAEIVNDVSGFRWDPNMKKTLAELKCGTVLMHSRGRPDEWAKLKPVPDVVTLVKRELREWADAAQISGMKRDHIMLDPGFGFGKRLEENYPLLKRFDEFHQLRYPLMVGVSRKSFIGRAIARNGTDAPLAERLHGTVAAETAAILKGTHMVRTHDVRACVEAAKLADLALI
jgi:dihydropteroate synthase